MKEKQRNPKKKTPSQQNNTNIINSNITINNSVNNIVIFHNQHPITNRIERETSPFLQNQYKDYPILNEINKNVQKHPKGRRWSPYAIGFFILLFFLSPF